MYTSDLPDTFQILQVRFWKGEFLCEKFSRFFFWAAYYEIINLVVKSTPNISNNDQGLRAHLQQAQYKMNKGKLSPVV